MRFQWERGRSRKPPWLGLREYGNPLTSGPKQRGNALVQVMRRDVRTGWTVRDDVWAKLRSSIKRLLVKYKYPPDQQPGAIKLVMEQMESLAPKFAAERAA